MLARLLGIVAPPLCTACGAHAGAAVPLCRACRAELAASALSGWAGRGVQVWSAFRYEGPAGALVRALKFGGRATLADTMAAHVVAAAPLVLWDGALVPVPLHPSRLARRGFNQSAVLARALSRRTGLPVADCLGRRGSRTPQSERGRAERMRAPAGAIHAVAAVPARVVLIDDVVTTGATLIACGKALSDAGCRHVVAITYARTGAR